MASDEDNGTGDAQRPVTGVHAPIDVPSYERAPRPVPAPMPDRRRGVSTEPEGPPEAPKPPPRRLEPGELLTESTKLAIGAVVATGRGLRAILEQSLAVAEQSRTETADAADTDDRADAAVSTNGDSGADPVDPERRPEAAGASTGPAPEEPDRPVAALRRPDEPETVLGALPTAAVGYGLQAQRDALASLAELRERYGERVNWVLEAPGVAPLYQRFRRSVHEWYRFGADEEQEAAENAVVALQEISDGGLGYVFDHLDLNSITSNFDINPLLENLELSDVILSSTGGIATDAIDNVRSQGVTVDDVLSRITSRLFRRKAERLPKGPGGSYGVAAEIPRWSGE